MAMVSLTSAGEMCCGMCFVGVEFQNVAVAKILGVSESAKTLLTYACAAKSLPRGLRDFSKYRSRDPGEGRERLLSISFQLQYTVYS